LACKGTLQVRMPHLRLLVSFVLLCLASSASARSSTQQGPPLQESTSYGAHTAKTYFDPASNSKDAYFVILKGPVGFSCGSPQST
jgi:hypothetical protein